MAARVAREKITNEQFLALSAGLTLNPTMSFFAKKRFKRAPAPPPVVFYRYDGNDVLIPYLYASGFFNYIPNLNNDHAAINVDFTADLRERQVPVEEEAWEQLKTKGTTTLGLFPSFGKTILGAKLTCRIRLLTIVLVNREILTTQWRNSYTKATNAIVWVVGERNPPPRCDVIICMDTRFNQIPAELRKRIGFLIIDEAHSFCTQGHVDCLLSFEPKYIAIETATLEREDNMHVMIYSIAGLHGVFREVNIDYKVYKINTGIRPERETDKFGGTIYTKLVENTLFNSKRNELIYSLVLSNLDKTFLILTSRVEHAALLDQELRKKGVTSDRLCGTKKNYNDAQILVGTTSKIGVGFDQANACQNYQGKPFDILILVCSIKKRAMLIQNVGRVFRTAYPVIFYLLDDDVIYKRHWDLAASWFTKTGGVIEEFNCGPPNQQAQIANTDTSQIAQAALDDRAPFSGENYAAAAAINNSANASVASYGQVTL